MKKLGAILLLVTVAISMAAGNGEAAWKKRGWYMKSQTSVCVMRKVSVVGANGKVAVQKIRVCR